MKAKRVSGNEWMDGSRVRVDKEFVWEGLKKEERVKVKEGKSIRVRGMCRTKRISDGKGK